MKENIIPTFEKMCVYKSIEPIDVKNLEIKECINWLEKNQLPYKLLLDDYLETIYNFAGMICDGVPLLTGSHKIEKNINEFWHRTRDWYDYYNPYTDKSENLFDNNGINLENKIIENFIVIVDSSKFKQYNLPIDIIYRLQQKLNSEKYKRNIDEIIPNNIKINAMCFFYYIANQLVMLSHDVMYAINERINIFEENSSNAKYSKNNNINKDKISIENKIIRPLSWTLELVGESMLNNGVLIDLLQSNENLLSNYDDRNNFKLKWNHRKYNMWDYAYGIFNVAFHNVNNILTYYKSEYYNILNTFEEQIQSIAGDFSKKSLTRDKTSVYNNAERDIYEQLSDCLESYYEYELLENHYKLGKLLFNKANKDEIIVQCKKCIDKFDYWYNTFTKAHISNNDIEIANNVINTVKNMGNEVINKIKNI